MFNFDAIVQIVDAAIQSLRSEGRTLDFSRAGERAVAHRLATHLERLVGQWNWDVDCEYNLDKDQTKNLHGIAGCDPEKMTDRVSPDIIVHRRRARGHTNNLLVVEMKKPARDDLCDIKRLELFTKPDGLFAYRFGLFLRIAGGAFHQTWFVNGNAVEDQTA